jgi:hypothetical protein
MPRNTAGRAEPSALGPSRARVSDTDARDAAVSAVTREPRRDGLLTPGSFSERELGTRMARGAFVAKCLAKVVRRGTVLPAPQLEPAK